MSSVAEVNSDGTLNISESSQQTERKTGSSLDKDDFLLLLVTQMQYQDPLEPTDNTQYVAQLAQFSELEQMENLNQTANNNTAYSLVGKTVYIEQKSSSGDVQSVQGTVDYVTIQNGKAKVSVDGTLYSYDDIVKVIDRSYLIASYLPSVKKQSVEFNHQDPQDISISGVSLGSNGYEASSVAVVLVDSSNKTTAIDAKYLNYKDGTLTIDREAFSKVNSGSYKIALVFNDASSTTDYDNVSLTIKGIITDTTDDSDSNAGDSKEDASGKTTDGDNTTEN